MREMLASRHIARYFFRLQKFSSAEINDTKQCKQKKLPTSTSLEKVTDDLPKETYSYSDNNKNDSGELRSCLPLSVLRYESAFGNAENAEKRSRRARLLDIWQHRSDYCEANFDNSKGIIMLDKELLIKEPKESSSSIIGSTNLLMGNCRDLRGILIQYGLAMGIENSVLLDFVDGDQPNRPDLPLFGCSMFTMKPPAESGISLVDLKARLAKDLGGCFVSQRRAIHALRDDYQREILAKFQGLAYWHHVHRYCPTCSSTLQMRASKAFSKCLPCNRRYYPSISPLVTCLVRDPSDTYCVLLRECGRPPLLFNTVFGVSEAGESLESTVLREVARSVGLYCTEVRALNLSQTWPPEAKSTLTNAFIATASMDQKLDPFFGDVEFAGWFTREEVRRALQNSRENADYLESVELEYETARALEAGERVYETQKKRPKDFTRRHEQPSIETYDTFEDTCRPDDGTTIIEEPICVEPIREPYRRLRKDDYEDEKDEKIEQEEKGLSDDEKELRRRRRNTSDAVFRVPSNRDMLAFATARHLQRLKFLPATGTIAHTLIQAWVDKRI